MSVAKPPPWKSVGVQNAWNDNGALPKAPGVSRYAQGWQESLSSLPSLCYYIPAAAAKTADPLFACTYRDRTHKCER